MKTPYNHWRSIVFLILTIAVGISVVTGVAMAARPLFSRDLMQGSFGNDVKNLQKFLNTHGFFVATKGAGSSGHEVLVFGPKTKKALTEFQKTHAGELERVSGSNGGAGSFSGKTRKFVNDLLEGVVQKKMELTQAIQQRFQGTAVNTYTLGGTITGITGPVVFQNNGGDMLTIRPGENSAFTFATALKNGDGYEITVSQAPIGQQCYLSSNAKGTIQGNSMSKIKVSCVPLGETNPLTASLGSGFGGGISAPIPVYSIGGSVTGLTGSMILQNNSGDSLTLSANGAFAFNTALLNGADYRVSILTQPEGEICSASYESGSVMGTDVTSVTITCLRITTIHTTNITVNNALLETPISPPLSTYVSSTSPAPFIYTIHGTSAVIMSDMLITSDYGTSTIDISQDAYEGYTAATGSLVFVANPTPVPTITGFSAVTKNYGDVPFSLSVHSNSEGAITYSIDDASVATVSGTEVTIHGAGLTVIHLVQAPWGIYPITVSRSVPLVVNRITPSITFTDITHAYDALPYALSASSPSPGGIAFESSDPSVVEVSGTIATILAAGTVTITATQATTTNYTAARTTASFTVPGVCADGACGPYSTSCTIDTHAVTCHCAAGMTGSSCNVAINACAIFPCGIHGICTRTSTFGGISAPLNSFSCACDSGYYGSTCGLLTPPPLPSITFAAITKYLGDSPFHFSISSNSSGAFTYDSSAPSVASVSGDLCTVVAVGTTTITAHQAADGDLFSSRSSSTLMTVYENYCNSHENPCLNSGVCLPSGVGYTCTCPEGYTGDVCQQTTDTAACYNTSAETDACSGNGTCIPSFGGGSCSCSSPFTGATCNMIGVPPPLFEA